jgi:hypothetical protein
MASLLQAADHNVKCVTSLPNGSYISQSRKPVLHIIGIVIFLLCYRYYGRHIFLTGNCTFNAFVAENFVIGYEHVLLLKQKELCAKKTHVRKILRTNIHKSLNVRKRVKNIFYSFILTFQITI